MTIKRCKHGMIENQCGVCQKWEERHWTQKKETKSEYEETENKKKAKA